MPGESAKRVFALDVPGIHVFDAASKTWMAGTSPAMTKLNPSRLLRLRLQSVEDATKNTLGKEYDEDDQQHAVDQIVPAHRLGAEADAQHFGEHDGDDGTHGGPERDVEAADDDGEHHLQRHRDAADGV